MCNCAGIQLSNATGKSKALFSNCAGNLSEAGHRTQVDCTCNKAVTAKADTTFSNATGNSPLFSGRQYSQATGDIAPIGAATTVKVTTAIPTVTLTTQQQTAATTVKPSTAPTLQDKVNSVLQTGTSILGLFGKKETTSTTTGLPLPEKKKGIPTAVWVVIGGVLLLVVAYFIVKAKKG